MKQHNRKEWFSLGWLRVFALHAIRTGGDSLLDYLEDEISSVDVPKKFGRRIQAAIAARREKLHPKTMESPSK